MPLGPLCDPSDVRLLLGESYDLDVGEDRVLNNLIKTASEEIRGETGRRFSTRESGVTRTYHPTKTDSVYIDELLSDDDVLAVVGPLGNLYATDYKVSVEGYPTRGSYLYMVGGERWPKSDRWPPEHLDWLTRNMRDLFAQQQGVDLRGKTVTVTGNFGYDELPAAIRHLAARTVAAWYKSEIATGGRGSAENNQLIPTAPVGILPEIIVTSLRRWKHPEPVS